MTDKNQIVDATKAYILREILSGEDAASLEPDTPLTSSGVLDSISTVKLIGFLEDEYGVEFEAHEISEDHLDSLSSIAELVQSKLAAK